MEEEFTLGRMAENMRENINLTKNMDSVSTFGKNFFKKNLGILKEDMKGIGLMANSMEMENI